MKLLYEKYSFLKNFREKQVRTQEGASLLGKYGFEFVKRQDNLTEVFQKIRFLDESELAKRRRDLGFSEDVSSLEHFMNTECKVTQFEEDAVSVLDFKDRYHYFCEVQRLDPLIVSRALMLRYGIHSHKRELTYVSRKLPS